MSAERAIYSIQRTYILKPVITQRKVIITCDERIDIPTIEPLTHIKVVPCIELVCDVLGGVDFTFETNE